MRNLKTLYFYRLSRTHLGHRPNHLGATRRLLHQHNNNNTTKHTPLEEQTLPRFHEKRYYPVKIGQTFNDHYRILTKLGYGAHSTVWLARDQRTNQYTCLKVFVRDDSSASPVANEIDVLRHIGTCSQEHAALMRLPDDVFDVEGHKCLAMKPMACSLQYMQYMFADGRVPGWLVRVVVFRLLGCINWLQLDCGVVHTGMLCANSS